jgi:hypothetical protein
MLIGYARVSTNEQDTAAQVAALKAGKCERVYREKASGGRTVPLRHRAIAKSPWKGECGARGGAAMMSSARAAVFSGQCSVFIGRHPG